MVQFIMLYEVVLTFGQWMKLQGVTIQMLSYGAVYYAV